MSSARYARKLLVQARAKGNMPTLLDPGIPPDAQQKCVYIAGKKRWADARGVFVLKLGSAVEARIAHGLDPNRSTKLDWHVEIDVLGENVLLDYRTTAEAAALLVTRKLRQILSSLKGIDNGTESKAKERGPSANSVPDKRGSHPSQRRAFPPWATQPRDGNPLTPARKATRASTR